MSVYNHASASASSTASCGLGLGTIGVITGIVLCILKGCGTLPISWFWAIFPLWIVPACYLAVIIIIFIIGCLISLVRAIKK